jgi:hypothetical protein
VSPASAATLVSSLVTLANEAPEALGRIEAWLKNEGERPDADLAALPDLARNHLELAALELRAKGTEG